jgi:hypothetical protein
VIVSNSPTTLLQSSTGRVPSQSGNGESSDFNRLVNPPPQKKKEVVSDFFAEAVN